MLISLGWMNAPAVAAKPTWTEKGPVLRLRERSRAFDFALTGVDNFRRHKTGRHGALLSHYGFLSVFPLFAVMTAILGFVLKNRPKLQASIVDSAFAHIPIIGPEIQKNPASIEGSVAVLVVALGTSLWAGTKCFVAAQNAMNDIWEVPEVERPKLAAARGRALLAIGVIGLSLVATGVVSGIASADLVGWLGQSLLVVAAITVNIAVAGFSFRVLTARKLTVRQIVPGAVAAGIAYSVLNFIGGQLVTRWLKNASVVYGTFGTVIALLAWLSLQAMVALISVEANAALDASRQRASSDRLLTSQPI